MKCDAFQRQWRTIEFQRRRRIGIEIRRNFVAAIFALEERSLFKLNAKPEHLRETLVGVVRKDLKLPTKHH